MNAFVCGTPVQIMRAIHMKYAIEEFVERSDIFIINVFNGAEKVANNLEAIGLFQNVYLLDVKMQRALTLRYIYGQDNCAKKIKSKKYNRLISFNLESDVINALYNINKGNEGFEYHCVEDAPGIYTIYEPKEYTFPNINWILGIEKPFFYVDKWWFSQPDLVELPLKNQVKEKLPSLDCNDAKLVALINRVFEYVADEKLEKADILITEESYFTDDRMVDNFDFELYSKVREEFPDKKILVKLHPRTKNNRFAKDFDVMEGTWIPWEVHLINRLNSARRFPIQLGIACNTLVSDKFMFDAESKKIVLAPIFYEHIKRRSDGSYEVGPKNTQNYLNIRLNYKNPEDMAIAYSEEDVFETLKNWIE